MIQQVPLIQSIVNILSCLRKLELCKSFHIKYPENWLVLGLFFTILRKYDSFSPCFPKKPHVQRKDKFVTWSIKCLQRAWARFISSLSSRYRSWVRNSCCLEMSVARISDRMISTSSWCWDEVKHDDKPDSCISATAWTKKIFSYENEQKPNIKTHFLLLRSLLHVMIASIECTVVIWYKFVLCKATLSCRNGEQWLHKKMSPWKEIGIPFPAISGGIRTHNPEFVHTIMYLFLPAPNVS